MVGESKLFQEPTALKTRKPFRDGSFSSPDGEKGLFFLLSAFRAVILWVWNLPIAKLEFFINKILHKIVYKLNQRGRS